MYCDTASSPLTSLNKLEKQLAHTPELCGVWDHRGRQGLTVNTEDPGDIRAGIENEGQVDILAVFLCVSCGSQRGDQFSTHRSEGAPTRCNEGF